MKTGHFGIGIINPKFQTNVGGIYRSAYCFNAAWSFTIGKRVIKQASDTPKTYNHIPIFNFATFKDFKKHIPFGTRLIGVELDSRAVCLSEFVHPLNAIYLLGAEDSGLPNHVRDACYQIIQIPAASLNVSSAASIVLYDRIAKQMNKLKAVNLIKTGG